MAGNSVISDSGLCMLTGLTYLDLWGAEHVTDKAVSCLSSLRFLSVQRNHMITGTWSAFLPIREDSSLWKCLVYHILQTPSVHAHPHTITHTHHHTHTITHTPSHTPSHISSHSESHSESHLTQVLYFSFFHSLKYLYQLDTLLLTGTRALTDSSLRHVPDTLSTLCLVSDGTEHTKRCSTSGLCSLFFVLLAFFHSFLRSFFLFQGFNGSITWQSVSRLTGLTSLNLAGNKRILGQDLTQLKGLTSVTPLLS